MGRSHSRRAHLAKKRATKRARDNGWQSKERPVDDPLNGSLYDAMKRERRHGG